MRYICSKFQFVEIPRLVRFECVVLKDYINTAGISTLIIQRKYDRSTLKIGQGWGWGECLETTDRMLL